MQAYKMLGSGYHENSLASAESPCLKGLSAKQCISHQQLPLTLHVDLKPIIV